MAQLKVSGLNPGMVLQKDAYNDSMSQLVLPKGTVLDINKIAKLEFYGVQTVEVEELQDLQGMFEFLPPPPVVEETPPRPSTGSGTAPSAGTGAERPYIPGPGEGGPSYQERLKSTPEFKRFKMNFEDAFIAFQRSINEVIRGNKELDAGEMVRPVYDLIKSCYGPSNVLSMLQAMREYDDETYVHSLNVALIAHTIGEWMKLTEDDLQILTEAGLLHDIGKTMIPHEILEKKEHITEDEIQIIRKHPELGYKALAHKNLDRHVHYAILQHHERCDGSGYPKGLTLKLIDPVARIVAIADVYDAMTSERVYRKARTPFYVVETMEKDALQKYDPQGILTFLENVSNTYIGNRVRLTDGREGEIVWINPGSFSRPTVKSGNDIIDLSSEKHLGIEALI